MGRGWSRKEITGEEDQPETWGQERKRLRAHEKSGWIDITFSTVPLVNSNKHPVEYLVMGPEIPGSCCSDCVLHECATECYGHNPLGINESIS